MSFLKFFLESIFWLKQSHSDVIFRKSVNFALDPIFDGPKIQDGFDLIRIDFLQSRNFNLLI
jgi:hypothetical protein